MPRPPRNVETERLNLVVSKAVRERLKGLQKATDADSMTQVIKKALAVYDFLWQEKSKGARLMVKSEDGERELVLL